MGILKGIFSSASGVLADSWKEYFYCDALGDDVLMVRGKKQTSSRSSNTKGNDNVITSGSGIAVADGQCALVVENGKIVDVVAEPGKFTFFSELSPTIFACEGSNDKFFTRLKKTFQQIGGRIGYGGDAGVDQRVYYINTVYIRNNMFGTPDRVPFRVVDSRVGFDVDIEVMCSGMYTFQIVDPLLFYTNVCANVKDEYRKETLAPTLKADFIDALAPALGAISALEVRPNQLPTKNREIKDEINKVLEEKWTRLNGIEIIDIAIKNLSVPKEYQELLRGMQMQASQLAMEGQRAAMYSNPGMAAGGMVGAQMDAMKGAATNSGGAMTGFMGVNMAQAAGGMNAQNLFNMAAQQQAAAPQQPAQPQAPANSWTCECGTSNTSKFCQNCGKPKPEPQAANGWTCDCGTVNQGKFCQNCGKPKPAGAKVYKCDKCGWVPEDPAHPPKFCPECGDIFDDNDAQ
ncbi:MAG: SPFH domain-containing protein [Ruminococcus sp.]|nr:SPFH domain-containing protein [Ruminococcus sp.]